MKTRMEPSEVIETSKSLFGKHGFKKVTMTDIATAAAISRPTLYSLYPDKEAVFAACILSHIDDFKKESLDRIRATKDGRSQLQVLFDIYIVRPFNWYFESEAYDMLVNASTYAPNEMAKFWKDFGDLASDVVQRAVKKRQSSSKDVAKVLVCFARDARAQAKTQKELKRLIDVAIELALQE